MPNLDLFLDECIFNRSASNVVREAAGDLAWNYFQNYVDGPGYFSVKYSRVEDSERRIYRAITFYLGEPIFRFNVINLSSSAVMDFEVDYERLFKQGRILRNRENGNR
jgi:hypothetical protein